MKRYFIVPLLCMTLLTGCGNKTFDKAMEEGKLAVANKEYEKAEGMFRLAIDEKKDDKEANALYNQTQKLIEAMQLKEDGNIEEVMALCEDIERIESKSEGIKKEANILKDECSDELAKTEEEVKLVETSITEAEELINDGKYSDAKGKLSELINTIENKDTLSSQIEKANTLIETCDNKIEEEKKKQESIKKKQEFTKSKAISYVVKMYGEAEEMHEYVVPNGIKNDGKNYYEVYYDYIGASIPTTYYEFKVYENGDVIKTLDNVN